MVKGNKTCMWMALWVFVVAILFAGCGEDKEQTPEKEAEYIAPVEVVQVQRENLTSLLESVGDLEASETAGVAAKISGRVSSVPVKLGDKVSKGQVLFTLDSTEAANAVAQAEASVTVAKTNIGVSEQTVFDAEQNFQRINQLFEADAASQSQYDQAESTLNNARLGLQVAQGQLRQAEITLANAQETLSYYTVVAPISGQVSSVDIHTGEMANAQTTAIRLVNLGTMKVKVNVSENIISHMQKGATVPMVVSALNREVNGRILSISPSIDEATKAFPVEITVDNSQGDMKVGMVVKLKLVSGTANNVLALPTDAVLEKDGVKYVFVMENDTAKEVKIKTALMTDTMIEIKEGLEEGQTVVTSGNELIKDGQKVKVTKGSESNSAQGDKADENS